LTEVERRQVERFSLETPGLLSMVDESGKTIAYEMTSKNICSGGAFFITEKALSVGTEVKVNLILSIKKDNSLAERKTRIDVSGHVIRTDEQGIAVSFYRKYNIYPVC
jgi:hypothetical protein